ncbi:MAG: DUF4406 domain-containing protein [Paludibacteraceae bacterium]|nr:DUF4406 domain-containing protein [Paludibacteraceae bacterium]
MKNKCYISGPITNIGLSVAIKNFAKSEATLIMGGLIPVNPIKEEEPGADWLECMRRDIKMLMDCDCIYMQIGWEESRGARIEHDLAKALGLSVIYEK